MPGFTALKAGKAELSVFRLWSGVTVRLCAVGTERLACGGGDTGGEDHENVAAGDALFPDLARLMEGRDGNTAEDEAEVDAFAHGSPPSMSVPPVDPGGPPRTRASKSVPPSPLLESNPLAAGGPPKLINSLRDVAVALLAPSSCSFRVCSFSTRADMDLMSIIYA
jgi:hypothetical protein